MDEMLKDARFAYIAKDPKFRRIPKAERKVKIDQRFKSMFEDEKFTTKSTIDKRGRRLNQSSTENLRKYYDLSSSEDEDASVPSTSQKDNKKKKKKMAKCTEKQANDRKKTLKEAKSSPIKELSDEESKDDESEKSSNNESDEFLDDKNIQEVSQLDLEENDKQLHERRKNENGKLTSEIKEKLKDLSMNYARGEGILLTDSSSEEESSEASDAEEVEIEHDWGELDKDTEMTDEITHRLAICNMNWDRIRAVDLMILLNSFLPTNGLIRSIVIYPSEFGQQRIKEEEINGPTELRNKDIDNEDEIEDDNEEGTQYDTEKLRQYQLNRLKYYYAVAEFDSVETANTVYTECDGIEYESSANRLDLRFIPDDMTFDQEPKETCTKIPESAKYQPRQFTTTALQQAKVQLTWDETNLERQEFTQKLKKSGKLQDIDENDLQTYLASASEDDSDIEEKKDIFDEANKSNSSSEINNDPIGKYKSLLKAIEEEEETKKNKNVELEVTWNDKEETEKLAEESTKNKEELTPFEQYLEKRKAKKKVKREERKRLKDKSQSDSEDSLPSDVDMSDKYFAEEFKNNKSSARKRGKKNEADDIDSSNEREEEQRNAELELLLMDEKEDGKKHFNMKQIEENATMSKSKRKRLNKKKIAQEETKEDDFEVDVKDARFAALFTSHHFNIDPTNPNYRKTKGTETLIKENLKRRADNETHVDDEQFKKPRTDGKLSTELQVLIKSVKKKAQNMTQPIKYL